MKKVNGCTYGGEWIGGKRFGIGTMKWTNGDNYVGEWKYNK